MSEKALTIEQRVIKILKEDVGIDCNITPKLKRVKRRIERLVIRQTY